MVLRYSRSLVRRDVGEKMSLEAGFYRRFAIRTFKII